MATRPSRIRRRLRLVLKHGDRQSVAADHATLIESIFDPLASRLADDGIVVLRNDDLVQVPPALGKLAVVRTRTYGNMVVTLLKKALGNRH
jgi:urease accessory protein UreE